MRWSWREHTGYPKELVYALPNHDYPRSLAVDPFGYPYQYRLTATGFELYSVGPDGVADTDDDMYPNGPKPICRRSRWDNNSRCARAVNDLRRFNDGWARETEIRGERPESLHTVVGIVYELEDPWNSSMLKDPWGERYRCGYDCEDARMASNGPDRQRGTADDIWLGGGYSQCARIPDISDAARVPTPASLNADASAANAQDDRSTLGGCGRSFVDYAQDAFPVRKTQR